MISVASALRVVNKPLIAMSDNGRKIIAGVFKKTSVRGGLVATSNNELP
jgi:hypothetical protein